MGFFEHRECWTYCASDWGTKQTTVCCYSGDILGYTVKFGVPYFWPRPFFPYKHVFKCILGISASRLLALENQLHGDNACPIAGEVYGIPFSPRPTGENLQDPAASCFFFPICSWAPSYFPYVFAGVPNLPSKVGKLPLCILNFSVNLSGEDQFF